jgi:hypothetical protein
MSRHLKSRYRRDFLLWDGSKLEIAAFCAFIELMETPDRIEAQA